MTLPDSSQLTIGFLLFWSFAAGLAVGAALGKSRIGWVVLAALPVAMIAYVAWWHGENPHLIRSTSGLDFIFGALWPSLGAAAGHFAGNWVRDYWRKR